jgi:nucleoside-diphosphate-sugar epimerase
MGARVGTEIVALLAELAVIVASPRPALEAGTYSGFMKVTVLGAGGGLGRNVVDAARAAGHEITALVRDPKRAELPAEVATVIGDATNVEDVARAMAGSVATMFCVNPSFASWLTAFPPLLDASIEAARRTGSRLVFPANVWVFGPGRPGDLVDEKRAASPTSQRGTMRAAMERKLRDAKIRHAIVRLPEFYGPSVVTLTAYPFRAALAGKRALWPGKLDVEVELVYMPDAGRALVAVGTAGDGDGETFHLPGARTTPRQFLEQVFAAASAKPRVASVPRWMLRVAGVFDGTVRGAADISHLWSDPILLDGAKYRARFGELPLTPLADAIATTMAWHRAHPALVLQ